jgi:hypothetical protein
VDRNKEDLIILHVPVDSAIPASLILAN